ncbi:YqaA family protein [Brevibacillus dissolubilis]|uniref:YqaA family protein n=1 Tax=Brevibacillus dissolubilis TaxID=1844116 RepID=UPI0011179268|nr:VTT domain-containing protein [Brevibacillus dissolubilis]
MFDQILHLFETYGEWGLFTMAFLDSFILPVSPLILQVAMSLNMPHDALLFALMSFLGTVAGAPVGFILGKVLGRPVMHKLLPKKWTDVAIEKFQKNGDGFLLIGAFTPIPIKVFSVLTGALGYSFAKLMLFTVLGRGVKSFLIGTLFYLYGKHAKQLLDDYMEVSLLGLALIVALLYVWWTRRKKKNNG